MSGERIVWKAFYTYDSFSNKPPFYKTDEIPVIAADAKEAFAKADQYFSSRSKRNKDLLERGQVNKQVTVYQGKAHFPELCLDSDKSVLLMPRVSKDGKSLEFIVKEE